MDDRPTPKILIFGSSYVKGQLSRFTFGFWRELVVGLNPGVDVLVVDSASPDLPHAPGATLLQLGDNIGHLSYGGADGSGRAVMAGIEFGLARAYDWLVHIETDLLFRHPVRPIIEALDAHDISAAAPLAYPHHFIETGLMFLRADAAKALLDGYDWHRGTEAGFPERRTEALLAGRMFTPPLRGMREDANLTAPAGLDWITHCRSPAAMTRFVKDALDGR